VAVEGIKLSFWTSLFFPWMYELVASATLSEAWGRLSLDNWLAELVGLGACSTLLGCRKLQWLPLQRVTWQNLSLGPVLPLWSYKRQLSHKCYPYFDRFPLEVGTLREPTIRLTNRASASIFQAVVSLTLAHSLAVAGQVLVGDNSGFGCTSKRLRVRQLIWIESAGLCLSVSFYTIAESSETCSLNSVYFFTLGR